MNENLAKKHQIVDAVHNDFKAAALAIVAEYRGVNVAGMSELRRSAHESNVHIQVVKNTLARRAVQETEFECLTDHFTGPVAIATADNPVVAAKTVSGFAKTNPQFKVQAGAMNGRLVNEDEINALASMPSREELLAMVVGTMAAPMQKLVSTLHALPSKLVRTMAAVRDQKAE